MNSILWQEQKQLAKTLARKDLAKQARTIILGRLTLTKNDKGTEAEKILQNPG